MNKPQPIEPMQAYPFTLILSRVREITAGVEDALFEAGCDDALLGERDGVVFLDFKREAPSVREAVLSAIADVEKAGIGAQVARVEPDELVSMAEISRRANRSRENIRQLAAGLRGPGDFPPPVANLKQKSPIWRWADVEAWLRQREEAEDTSPGLPTPSGLGSGVAAINAGLELLRHVEDATEAKKLLESLQSKRAAFPPAEGESVAATPYPRLSAQEGIVRHEKQTADVEFTCPHCHGGISDDGTLAGHVVLCPHCHKRLAIPRPRRYFVCNTDRKEKTRSFDPENLMLGPWESPTGYATAWVTFNFLSHMQMVDEGDYIFMFARGVGVIAVGEATDRCEGPLLPGDPRRLGRNAGTSPEWRVHVKWLAKRREKDACRLPQRPLVTFIDVSPRQPKDTWCALRDAVMRCFPEVPWG
jgi:hypothetical protein